MVSQKIGQKRKLIGDKQFSKKKRRGLPTELVNELFAAMPLENAFELLAKMPNGLLARNIQKMFKSFKMAVQANKWNSSDCGQQLIVSQERLIVNHYGYGDGDPIIPPYCVRAILPVPKLNFSAKKPSIAIYFEVKVHGTFGEGTCRLIRIGFCTLEFRMEKEYLGKTNNSIGTLRKGDLWIDESVTKFENVKGFFKEGDVIGLGLIHSMANPPMECFATCNGELLWKTKLPAKFAALQMFPAMNMYHNGDSFRANFGNDKWCFKQFKSVLE